MAGAANSSRAAGLTLALRAGTRLGGDDVTFAVRGHRRGGALRAPPAVVAALRRLAGPGVAQDELLSDVAARGGAAAAATLGYHLRRLSEVGLVDRTACCDGRPLATSIGRAAAAPRAADGSVALSRFAYMRARDGRATVESPLARGHVVLHDPRAAVVVHALSRPATVAELAAGADLPHDAACALAGLLVSSGMAVEIGEDGASPEDADAALRCWEFHDLLVHARSRARDEPSGATFRLAGELPCLGPLRPAYDGPAVALRRPDLEALRSADPPFAAVVEGRRSVRRYGARVVSLGDLGEFLFRTARVTGEERVEMQAPDGPLELEVARRPYPGAGALHELEVYVVVARCDGLERGMYHYEPSRHRLVRLAASEQVEPLLAGAAAGAALAPGDLQLLLVISARVPRLAWKYEGMAYSAVLKDAGVLLGAMYLAATAMGLSPCAIGNGDCDAFACATGTPPAEETSVAELLLGGAPASGGGHTIFHVNE